jgi:hypothetical protein
LRSIEALSNSPEAVSPDFSGESPASPQDNEREMQQAMNVQEIDEETQEWMDSLGIGEIHPFNTSEGIELRLTGTISQDGDVWYAIMPQMSFQYECMVYPDIIDAGVKIYDSGMAPLTPEHSGTPFREGSVYFIRVNFRNIDSPQEYILFVSPWNMRISEYWMHEGDFFEESPSKWFALTPQKDGTYHFDFEYEDRSISAAVWEWDDELKRVSLDANSNTRLLWGQMYFIEIRTSARDFYSFPYIITIQLFDDGDDDFIYPDDEDYYFDDSYDPSRFEYID